MLVAAAPHRAFQIALLGVRVHQQADQLSRGYKFVQLPQPLGNHIDGGEGHAGNVAARPVHAGDEAGPYRIAADHEDDRRRRRCRLDRLHCNAVADDHGRLTTNQILRERRQPIAHAVGPAVFDRDVLAFEETSFLQALPEGGHEVDRVDKRADAQKADHRHRRLLRPCRERPRCCAAEQ